MDEGIFSTYRQGENRVTASILAVLRSLALPRIERILGALLKEPDFELVRFENQIAGRGESVPDGKIAASARILLETKTTRNALAKKQLKNHLAQLTSEAGNRLLVLTPDHPEPAVIKQIGDDRLVWTSFAELNHIAADVLPEGREADALHVAAATCLQLDYLVSWNHRHMTRAKKRLQYEEVNRLQGYLKTPIICNPFEACDEIRD